MLALGFEVGAGDDDLAILRGGDVLDGPREFGPEGVRDVVDDQADLPAAATPGEVGCDHIATEAEFAHRGHDPLGRFWANTRLVVDDARDRLEADACDLRHVTHGGAVPGAITPAPGRPVSCVHGVLLASFAHRLRRMLGRDAIDVIAIVDNGVIMLHHASRCNVQTRASVRDGATGTARMAEADRGREAPVRSDL